MMMAGKTLRALVVAAASVMLLGQQAHADDEVVERTFCVWDPVGSNGRLFSLMQSQRPLALEQGVDLKMRAYTNEHIAAEEFRAGQCDKVLLTGTMARDFNEFTGSLDAMGAIPGEEEMRMLMRVLSQDSARQYLRNGEYEVAGILPAGSLYLFLRDRSIDSVEKLQGKRIAVPDHDRAAVTMVRHVGASVVGSTTTNFAGRFNNGSVDAAPAPAVAYEPMELYRGLAENGGIYNYKIAQMNFQIIARHERFSEEYLEAVREHSFNSVDGAYDIIREAEETIDENYWMHPSAQEKAEYDEMARGVRIQLRDEGVFDETALRVMRGIRCRTQPDRAECTENSE